jgi:hypothetical protein
VWDAPHVDRIVRFALTKEVMLPDGGVRVARSEGSYLSMLRQLSSGLMYAGEGDSRAFVLSQARMDALESLMDSVQGPVLVAIFYKAEVEALLQRFAGRARAFVGSTPPRERAELIAAWNADEIPVLFAAPGAMGHGINLQHGSCRTLVWFTHSFDWAQRAQMNARLVRAGQSKVISIVNLVADAGLDRVVLDLPEPWQVVPHAARALRPGDQHVRHFREVGDFFVVVRGIRPQTFGFRHPSQELCFQHFRHGLAHDVHREIHRYGDHRRYDNGADEFHESPDTHGGWR